MDEPETVGEEEFAPKLQEVRGVELHELRYATDLRVS